MKGPKGVKSHPCPKCGRIRHFKTRAYYRAAVRTNTICKRCAYEKHREAHTQRSKEWWEKWNENASPTEIEAMRKKRSASAKRVWDSRTDEEKEKLLKQAERARERRLFRLRSPKLRAKWIAKQKKAFEKYRGENHWTNRRETYFKILKSNEKYVGENHWFKRPEVWKRWCRAMKKRYGDKFDMEKALKKYEKV